MCHKSTQFWVTNTGATWIPEPATDLQLRLCIIAHTSASGHRGRKATESALQANYDWKTLFADVMAFIKSCTHCCSTTGGEKMPGLFGPPLYGTKPNDLIHFDYIEIVTSYVGAKYVLMIRDNHSNCSWLFPFVNTTADNAAIAIID